MKDRYIKILLTVIAINLTVISLNSVVDRFVSDAKADYFSRSTLVTDDGLLKVAICDPVYPSHCASVFWRATEQLGRLLIEPK